MWWKQNGCHCPVWPRLSNLQDDFSVIRPFEVHFEDFNELKNLNEKYINIVILDSEYNDILLFERQTWNELWLENEN